MPTPYEAGGKPAIRVTRPGQEKGVAPAKSAGKSAAKSAGKLRG